MPAFALGSSTVNCALAENVVKCVGGFVVNDDGSPSATSCFTECADKCCSSTGESGGANACPGFTGSVCRDGSCIGQLACEDAGNDGGFIGLIEGASCVGLEACYRAGHEGRVDSIKDASCVGTKPCFYAGQGGGHVNSITDASCVGTSACQYAGMSGRVDSIKDASCLGTSSCAAAGYGGEGGEGVNSIKGASCVGTSACADLGRGAGAYITSVNNCCKTDEECRGDRTDAYLPADCAAPPVPVTTNPSDKPTPMVSVNPSGGPTLVPSVAAQDPSSSPTPFPWFIEFEGLAANFSAF